MRSFKQEKVDYISERNRSFNQRLAATTTASPRTSAQIWREARPCRLVCCNETGHVKYNTRATPKKTRTQIRQIVKNTMQSVYCLSYRWFATPHVITTHPPASASFKFKSIDIARFLRSYSCSSSSCSCITISKSPASCAALASISPTPNSFTPTSPNSFMSTSPNSFMPTSPNSFTPRSCLR